MTRRPDWRLYGQPAVRYYFIVHSTQRPTVRRRSLASMLGLLLSMSIVGQQLPCLHSALTPRSGVTTTLLPPAELPPAPHHSAPVGHHDPATTACAQLMTCGLAVQVSGATTPSTNDVPMATAVPIGAHLQFSTADLEVESPPPRG